jgi:hypothetical protein
MIVMGANCSSAPSYIYPFDDGKDSLCIQGIFKYLNPINVKV